jgi:cytoskeletal protein RodZ
MKLLRLKSAIVVVLLVLGISGCSQKKPVLVAPQQPPPITAPEPTPTPEPEATSQPAGQPQETQPATTTEKSTTAAKSKPKSTKPTAVKKPAATSTGNEVARNNTKIVVPADRATTPTTPAAGQISPGPTAGDGSHSQTSTEQLLQSAEENLNRIKRQLSKDEEAMRAQIREFISQSHKATTENDLARAHNFAVKARLLSDELVKSQ